MNTGQDGYNRCLQEQHKYCNWGYWCLYLGLEYDTECTQDAVHCHVDESRLLHLLVDINHSKKNGGCLDVRVFWINTCIASPCVWEQQPDDQPHCIGYSICFLYKDHGRPYTSTDEKGLGRRRSKQHWHHFFLFLFIFL